LIVGGVGLDELLLIFRHFAQREDRGRGAYRNAGATIYAIRGVDVKVRSCFKPRLVLARMDAIYRANLDTFFVFGAGVYDYVSHGQTLPQKNLK
jgi:hypothetical protein